MKIRKLVIRNFRGIRECDWHIPSDFVCMVGPGDSTKTTLLDAMGLVLSRNHSVQFTDADFYMSNTSENISIRAAVTSIPKAFFRDFPGWVPTSGIDEDGTLLSEDEDGSTKCVLIELRVGQDLEPIWEIIRVDESKSVRISAYQRKQLGFFRLGDFHETHLRWSRNSALTAMSEKNSAKSTIAEAHRIARAALFESPDPTLGMVVEEVQESARALGANPFDLLRPGLDPVTASTGNPLLLHDNLTPLTRFGKGTQRLTSLAIQNRAVVGGSIIAIDEVETGLEPHRLSHLLRTLKRTVSSDDDGQLFFTTHSPTAIETLSGDDIWVIRRQHGRTVPLPVPAPINDKHHRIRSAPTALLARVVIVGEGATEKGFIQTLLNNWDIEQTRMSKPNSVTLGISVIDGGGTPTAQRGLYLAQLRYRTALLLDNDNASIDADVEEARRAGAEIFRCAEGRSLEEDIAYSLDSTGLQSLLNLAGTHPYLDESYQWVLAQVKRYLTVSVSHTDTSVAQWISSGVELEQIQKAVGSAAAGRSINGRHAKDWFKSYAGGCLLAELLLERWPSVSRTEFGSTLQGLSSWVYESDVGRDAAS